MHPFISLFSRNKFYDGLLKDGIEEKDRVLNEFRFPNPKKPVFFVSCQDEEQTSPTGYSYLNVKEGSIIAKIVYKLTMSGIKPQQIGKFRLWPFFLLEVESLLRHLNFLI